MHRRRQAKEVFLARADHAHVAERPRGHTQVKNAARLPINTAYPGPSSPGEPSVQAPFLVHPANRGGGMLSWHDCHHKGQAILATGPDFAKISQSVCVELATDPQKRQTQIQASQG